MDKAQRRRESAIRYNNSAKGRASVARYQASAKGKAAAARHRASEKGRATKARHNTAQNRRRLYAGQRYVGNALTATEAAAINAHIKERLLGFIARQSAGAQIEGLSAGAVPPQASPGAGGLGGGHFDARDRGTEGGTRSARSA